MMNGYCKNKIKNIAAICSVVVLLAFGQTEGWKETDRATAAKEIKKIYDLFNANCFSMDIVHEAYFRQDVDKINETHRGFYKRFGNKYHSYSLGVRTIQDGKLKLIVDSVNKTMQVSFADKDLNLKELDAGKLENVNKLLRKSNSETVTYRLINNTESMFDKIDISGSGTSKQLSEMILYYRYEVQDEKGKYKPKIVVKFSNYKKPASIPDNEFSITPYVTEKDKVYRPTTAYKNYKVYDSRIK